jgi:cell division protein FtsN
MGNEERQKELFEFDKPKSAFSGIGRIFNLKKGDIFENRFAITLSIERLIILSIAVIMFMVVTYALGVERGKAAIRNSPVVTVARAIVTTQPAISIKPVAPVVPVRPVAPVAVKPAAVNKPYTIVAVTFSSKDYAAIEAGKLKKNGFDAWVYPNNSYFQVRIGAYDTKESAQPVLNKLKRVYRDAYIKTK